jgi:hypothetical protein
LKTPASVIVSTEERSFFDLKLLGKKQSASFVREPDRMELDLISGGRREPRASHHADFSAVKRELRYVVH